MAPFPDELEVQGILVDHWEAHRFLPDTSSEVWQLVLPAELSLPARPPGRARGPARYFDLRLRGKLGAPGSFGHMGMCSRQFVVSAILFCSETQDPGK